MNKLGEIIETTINKDETLTGYDLARNVALEFAKHILEEAAENSKTIVISDFEIIVNKQSITEVLNKYL